MNERIKELAEQAGAGWDDKYHWYVGSVAMEKFAELIVRECVQVLVNRNAPNVYGEHIGVEEIKQHFGITS